MPKKIKKTKEEAFSFGEYLLSEFNVVPVRPEYVKKAFSISIKYQFSYWDSLIIASALENDCDILYTEDMQHNQKIEDALTIINPFK